MDTKLDYHSKSILEILLESNSPITTGEIAGMIDISPRMVRYRLPNIFNWIRKKGGNIYIKPNYGINLEIQSDDRNHLLSKLSKGYVLEKPMLPQDRQDFIKFLLLICDTPIATKQIKYELDVSKVTILKDLDIIENWLHEKKLQLIRKPGYGIEIFGNEGDVRKAIVEYFIDKLGGLSLAKLCRGSSALQSIKSIKTLHEKVKLSLIEYLTALDLSYSWQLTNQIENGLDYQLSEHSYIYLVLYLSVFINRLRQKVKINKEDDKVYPQDQIDEYYIAKIISDKIQYRYGVESSKVEIDLLAEIISGLETKKVISDIIVDIKNLQISAKADTLTKKILADVSMLLHPYLLVDPSLYKELSNHIQTLLSSIRIPIKFRQDICDQLKQDSPHVFSIAKRAVKQIEDEIGFKLPETEIGLISVLLISALERICPPHRIIRNVIIVNDSGYETTSLLKSRLTANIPEIKVVDCIGPLEMLSINLTEANFDAIITTLELERLNIPSILVNPLLPIEDIQKIKEILNIPPKTYKGSLSDISSLGLWNLLQDETINLDVEVTDWIEVVQLSGLLLLNVGAIYPGYITAMKDLIVENGPYVVSGPGIALLHARPDQGAKRTCLSLIRLKNPVEFGHSTNDPVDLIFALSAADSISPQKALFDYVELIGNNELQNEIRMAKTKGNVINLLKRLGL